MAMLTSPGQAAVHDAQLHQVVGVLGRDPGGRDGDQGDHHEQD
ncbi:hypothetical protein FLP41_00295 (plasmid) [Paracoccus marcusii]|nr:hypothetical protein FLP41_00295 [Paracoccus marcusii]